MCAGDVAISASHLPSLLAIQRRPDPVPLADKATGMAMDPP